MIELKKTDTGLLFGEFRDQHHKLCSIQESSLATEPCIWLGTDGNHRMHLTHQNVADLVPLLMAFLETGGINPSEVQPTSSPADMTVEKLLNLIVRPFRGKWETCDGPRQVGLYATCEEAVAATIKAANELADEGVEP